MSLSHSDAKESAGTERCRHRDLKWETVIILLFSSQVAYLHNLLSSLSCHVCISHRWLFQSSWELWSTEIIINNIMPSLFSHWDFKYETHSRPTNRICAHFSFGRGIIGPTNFASNNRVVNYGGIQHDCWISIRRDYPNKEYFMLSMIRFAPIYLSITLQQLDVRCRWIFLPPLVPTWQVQRSSKQLLETCWRCFKGE